MIRISNIASNNIIASSINNNNDNHYKQCCEAGYFFWNYFMLGWITQREPFETTEGFYIGQMLLLLSSKQCQNMEGCSSF